MNLCARAGRGNRRSLHCAALRSRRQGCGIQRSFFPKRLRSAAQQLCRLDRSAAQWRDLRFTSRLFLLKEPHADHQRHSSPQNIRGNELEGFAMRLAVLSNPPREVTRMNPSYPPVGPIKRFPGADRRLEDQLPGKRKNTCSAQ
jgi:hypothetical protein